MTDSLSNKQKILSKFLDICILDGWNNETLNRAVIGSGLKEQEGRIIFKNGIYDLIDFFIDQGNEKMKKSAKDIKFDELRVRDKIKTLVKLRLEIESDNKNIFKSLTTISKGRRVPYLLKNNYKIADIMWQVSGDSSSDISHYTKRLILSKVFAKTLLFFINDDSKANKDSWIFLDREIEKVIKIHEIKMTIKNCKEKVENFIGKSCNLSSNLKKLPFFRLHNNHK